MDVISTEDILIFRSSHGHKTYAPAHDSVHCFAKCAGHEIIDVNLDTDQFAISTCKEFTDKNFLRHCVLAQYLNVSMKRYALALEGDVAVINPENSTLKYIDPYASIVFYERFRTFEIAAGSYIVKNDEYAAQFLMDWARYFHKQPNGSWTNGDNGALLALILEKRSVASYERSVCTELWRNSKSLDDLRKYIQCVIVFLGARRENVAEKIKVLRRGHSWMRDKDTADGYWCNNDFFFHDIKSDRYFHHDKDRPYLLSINVSACELGQAANNFHLNHRMNISCDELRAKFCERLQVPNVKVPLARDGDLKCWPHCDDR